VTARSGEDAVAWSSASSLAHAIDIRESVVDTFDLGLESLESRDELLDSAATASP
jgi:hypothetical protein